MLVWLSVTTRLSVIANWRILWIGSWCVRIFESSEFRPLSVHPSLDYLWAYCGREWCWAMWIQLTLLVVWGRPRTSARPLHHQELSATFVSVIQWSLVMSVICWRFSIKKNRHYFYFILYCIDLFYYCLIVCFYSRVAPLCGAITTTAEK